MSISAAKKRRIRSMALVLVGNIILALAIKLFLLPANLMGIGATGISLVAEHFLHIPVSRFMLVFNVVMLLFAWWLLGRQFTLTTVFSSIFYPVMLEVLDYVLGDYLVTQNMLLNALFAGMGVAFALGLVIRGGGCTGGMDIPLLILERYFRIPVAASMWVTDLVILLMQAMFHPVEDLLYGVILVIAITITLDKTILMGTSKTEVKIISDRPMEIRDAIMNNVDRGVTLLHAESGFRQQQMEIVLTVIATKELIKIERVARTVDPNCFVIVNRVSEVWGGGFTTEKKRLEKNK